MKRSITGAPARRGNAHRRSCLPTTPTRQSAALPHMCMHMYKEYLWHRLIFVTACIAVGKRLFSFIVLTGEQRRIITRIITNDLCRTVPRCRGTSRTDSRCSGVQCVPWHRHARQTLRQGEGGIWSGPLPPPPPTGIGAPRPTVSAAGARAPAAARRAELVVGARGSVGARSSVGWL